jgi:hypothetical protein
MVLAPRGKCYAGKIYYPRVDDMLQSPLGLQEKVVEKEEMRSTQRVASNGVSDRLKRMISIALDCSWVHRIWTAFKKSDPLKVGMEAGVG